jgi:hypothetical protein
MPRYICNLFMYQIQYCQGSAIKYYNCTFVLSLIVHHVNHMKKISNCILMLHNNTKAMSITGLLYHTTTNHMYVVPYYAFVIKSKVINIKYYLKVLHPHCVLFNYYTEKHSLMYIYTNFPGY